MPHFHVKHAYSWKADGAAQLRREMKEFELRTGDDLSWSELGRRAWKVLGRAGAPDTSKLSRIKKGQQEPSLEELWAFGAVLGVPPGQVAFPNLLSVVSSAPTRSQNDRDDDDDAAGGRGAIPPKPQPLAPRGGSAAKTRRKSAGSK